MVIRWLRSGSFWSHAPARLAGTVVLALLCALAGGFTLARPARASCQPCGTGPGQIAYGGVTASASNTVGAVTYIPPQLDVPTANEFVEVTADGAVGGANIPLDTHQVGVWYDSAAGKWAVFNEDLSAMPLGVAFDVYTQQHYDASAFLWTATSASTSGYITLINNAALDGNPSAQLVVTQVWSSNSPAGFNPNAIGVWYDWSAGEWTIYDEDGSAIPIGSMFNVFITNGTYGVGAGAKVEVATAANTVGATFCMSDEVGIGNIVPFATHVYSGYITDVVGFTANFTANEYCLTDASGNAIPIGSEFFIF